MNEIEISFNIDSPQKKDSNIVISAISNVDKPLMFKFFAGCEGIWDTLQDFSTEDTLEWNPKKEGKYIIMIQAKEENSTKPFDYVSRVDYIIGEKEEKIVNKIYLEKSRLKVGEKLRIVVESNKLPMVYKYWIKEKDSWELIRDYSAENTLTLTAKNPGKQEIMVECKAVDSRNTFDDCIKTTFEVVPFEELQIKSFNCLSSELLADNELIFQVDTSYEDNRMVLYKFIKINAEGIANCIQDYSTKRMVSFNEKVSGDYRLLCLAKDMYSPMEYDDRALIKYNIKPYNPVSIQSFTTDLSSPQIKGTEVLLKAVVKGGKDLVYRYIIDGNLCEDSGYIKENTYLWNSKYAGKYKVTLWVKDSSCESDFEDQYVIDFTIDEESKNPVKIKDVILSKYKDYIKNELINVKVIAEGGTDLRYSFVVIKDNNEVERIKYGSCNWVNFTPEEEGRYDLEVKVKDKYSSKEYDCHSLLHFDVQNFLPAEIDYVMIPPKEHYMVDDVINLDVIARRTNEIRIKYILKINAHKVEETDFVKAFKYSFTPKCKGVYLLEMQAKNKSSDKIYDCKREIKINVYDAFPITNTKIQCDKTLITVNNSAIFSVKQEGGKDVCYEFYLLEQGEWNLVQKYSKKNYYSFMAFAKGNYKILALCKSQYKECAYEDYDILEFNVE